MAIALHDHVLVLLPDMEIKSAGGIFLPESEAQKVQRGSTYAKILGLGEIAFHDRKVKPQVGDIVIINNYSGMRVPSKEKLEKRLMHDMHIMGIAEPSDLEGLCLNFGNVEPLVKKVG